MPKKTRHILLTSDRIDLQRVWDRILATDTPSVHYKYEMLGFILYANSSHSHGKDDGIAALGVFL